MALRANRGRLRLVETARPSSKEVAASSSPSGKSTPAPPSVDASSETPVPGVQTSPVDGGRGSAFAGPSDLRDAKARSSAGGTPITALPDAQLVALGCKGEVKALE